MRERSISMGVFTHWPYTNIHEMNLDWMLEQIKKYIEEWRETSSSFATLEDAFDDLKNYVDTYFANLDIQTEVSNKLDQMLEDGELDEILKGSVVTWDRNFGDIFSGECFARERQYCREIPTDRTSRLMGMQNGVVYSPTNNYENDGSQKYIYYWRTWVGSGGVMDNQNTTLITYDVNQQSVTSRIEVEYAGHGGELRVKDGKLYCLTAYTPYRLIIFDISSPAAPVLLSNEINNLNSHRIAGWNPDTNSWMCVAGERDRRVFEVGENFAEERYLFTLESNPNTITQDYCYDHTANVIAVLSTEPNTVVFNDAITGKAIHSLGVPYDISYINSGECQWVTLREHNLYIGGSARNGVYGSETVDFNTFYCNAHISHQYERQVSENWALVKQAIISQTADPRNPASRVGEQNITFRYFEDAVNYLLKYGRGQINFNDEYPYSFRVPIDCYLNLNGVNHGAVSIDQGVECVITGLSGSLLGEPFTATYNNRDITTYYSISYGCKVTISNMAAIPQNRADVNMIATGSLLITHSQIKSIYLINCIVLSSSVVAGNIYAENTMFNVVGFLIADGSTQYLDNNCIIQGDSMTSGTETRGRFSDFAGKPLPRPARVFLHSTTQGDGKALSNINIYGGVGTATAIWGYYHDNGATYVRNDYTIVHSTETAPIGNFTAHKWQFTLANDMPSNNNPFIWVEF